MNRRNYARELQRIIEKRGLKKPRVLLHACCGPCSTSVLEYLNQYFDITVLWYNPNLYPETEYNKRFETLIEVIEKMKMTESVDVMAEKYKHNEYLKRVKGLEREAEGGKRCEECFKLRLLETAKMAKQYGYDYFCSTLTVSRHKDAVLINSIGEEMALVTGTKWLPSDFKKRDGENRAVELSEQLGIYRQLYCGCEFSLANRESHEQN